MSSSDDTAHWLLAFGPRTYTEEDTVKDKHWPVVSLPKPGAIYPTIFATDILPSDLSSPLHSNEWTSEIDRIKTFIADYEPCLRGITSDEFSKENRETGHNSDDSAGWTKDEAQHKCNNILRRLQETNPIINNLALTHTCLEVSWVNKWVVFDAGEIKKVASKNSCGAFVLSKKDSSIFTAHYPSERSKYSHQQQAEMFETNVPHMVGLFVQQELNDRQYMRSLERLGFGGIVIDKDSVEHFPWLSACSEVYQPQ